jgi:hypothetical protein
VDSSNLPKDQLIIIRARAKLIALNSKLVKNGFIGHDERLKTQDIRGQRNNLINTCLSCVLTYNKWRNQNLRFSVSMVTLALEICPILI